MPPLYISGIGLVLVVGKASTLSQQLLAIAALTDPRQDIDASAPHSVAGLSKQVMK